MSLWSRLFGRKPEPPSIRDLRRANDWQPGDLAVCLRDDWERPTAADPVKGEVRRVSGVSDGVGQDRQGARYRAYFLSFEGYSRQCAWSHWSFRKAEEDHEPAEAEFTALIKRPVRKRERA